MNYLSIGISGFFSVLSVAFVVLLLAAITNNLKTASRYRQNIGKKLSSLRLSRMLSFHHIDRKAYLHAQPILDIEEQMTRCSNCAETQRCDQVLAENANADTTFCDNDDELQQLKNKLGSAA
jgi:hypothetical protein